MICFGNARTLAFLGVSKYYFLSTVVHVGRIVDLRSFWDFNGMLRSTSQELVWISRSKVWNMGIDYMAIGWVDTLSILFFAWFVALPLE